MFANEEPENKDKNISPVSQTAKDNKFDEANIKLD